MVASVWMLRTSSVLTGSGLRADKALGLACGTRCEERRKTTGVEQPGERVLEGNGVAHAFVDLHPQQRLVLATKQAAAHKNALFQQRQHRGDCLPGEGSVHGRYAI